MTLNCRHVLKIFDNTGKSTETFCSVNKVLIKSYFSRCNNFCFNRFIGGLYGRIIGEAMVQWFGIHVPEEEPFWAWIDPGAMALIGAASFFGGVSRLTMSLTVIMVRHENVVACRNIFGLKKKQRKMHSSTRFQVEITNDISFLLPIMSAIMISKWVGDYFTHPLYHALLEFKCIPFLDSEPVVYQQGKHL